MPTDSRQKIFLGNNKSLSETISFFRLKGEIMDKQIRKMEIGFNIRSIIYFIAYVVLALKIERVFNSFIAGLFFSNVFLIIVVADAYFTLKRIEKKFGI